MYQPRVRGETARRCMVHIDVVKQFLPRIRLGPRILWFVKSFSVCVLEVGGGLGVGVGGVEGLRKG